MAFNAEFVEIKLEELHLEAAVKKAEGWRFIQTHAVNTDDGVDLIYSFMKNGAITNLKVPAVQKGVPVPSITDLFLAAFVFENEARELFGINMQDIAIDFAGAMYAPAISEPMTIITPEQKAAREKARKAAAAKQAKESGDAGEEQAAKPAGSGFVMTEEKRAKLEAKLATMSPEKVKKVRDALAAREAEAAAGATAAATAAPAAEEQPAKAEAAQAPAQPEESKEPVDAQLEAKIAALPPEKAAKVRAALGIGSVEEAGLAADEEAPSAIDDAQLEAKISAMDPAKAEKVRAALAARAGQASAKGGE